MSDKSDRESLEELAAGLGVACLALGFGIGIGLGLLAGFAGTVGVTASVTLCVLSVLVGWLAAREVNKDANELKQRRKMRGQ